MVKKYMQQILTIIIIILGILFVIVLENNMLKINTVRAIKEDVFKSNSDNEIYYEYVDIFEKYIFVGEYEKAYKLLNKHNAEEKFDGVSVFKSKMMELYSQNNDVNYTILDIVNKPEYNDIYFKATIIDKEYNYDVLQIMIREYNTFNYNIFFLTEL